MPSIELSAKLAEIQKELKAPKNQFNKFANFYYRSCEDILEGVKPLLKGAILTIRDDIVQVGDRYYVKATACISDPEGKSIEVSAFAREAEVKTGMDSAQITGATSSYARKYALNGLFLIDDTQDADTKDNTKAPGVATTNVKPQTSYATNTPARTVAKSQPKRIDTPEAARSAVEELNAPLSGAFRNEAGEINRDHLGHTACVSCGKMVSPKVEQYSIQKHGKVLCMACQLKEGGKPNAKKVEEIKE